MLRPLLAAAVILVVAGCADRISTVPVPAPPAIVPPAITPPAPSVFAVPMPTVTVPQAAVPSCTAQPERAFAMQIPAGALDTALLDRAILFHTNRARCRAGLRPLAPDPRLRAVATEHSADMVRLGFFGHTSPATGKATMGDRLKLGGVPYRSAAENLATAKRLEIGSGQPVYPLGTGRCAYSLTPKGRRVPVRSYDSLARNLVDRWMDSPGHRRNLINPDYSRHGASGWIDPNARLCESISATQLFAG